MTDDMKTKTRYTITIEAIGFEETTIGGEWRQGAKEDGGYGYTPNETSIHPYRRTVYEQTVEDLDMASVIRAVNKLG